MNKLVKGNLVRGLPSKLFENDETHVACQKGKQHRASYDYSRFTWVFFLATKDETSGILKSFISGIENLVDHKGILRQYSVARTPQQNEVVERRNRTLIEATRTMLADSKLADEGFFVGYSLNSKAFRVFNSKIRIVEENLHIRFSESTPNVAGSGSDWLFDIDTLTRIMTYEPIVAGTHDDGKKVDEDLRKVSEYKDQEKEDNVNNTNNVNVAGTNKVNAV
ncbi:putative ribonuclease H-like domain-containing protein, partial [Tanacetum coccineum]